MREILFRGKRVDNGKWMYGYYVQKLHPYSEDGEPRIHFIMDVAPFGQAVFPDTLCQYTGRTDKKGKRIFEGDIMRHKVGGVYGLPMVVAFEDGAFIWRCRDKWETLYQASCDKFEIIGNIHDNPELLEGIK